MLQPEKTSSLGSEYFTRCKHHRASRESWNNMIQNISQTVRQGKLLKGKRGIMSRGCISLTSYFKISTSDKNTLSRKVSIFVKNMFADASNVFFLFKPII